MTDSRLSNSLSRLLDRIGALLDKLPTGEALRYYHAGRELLDAREALQALRAENEPSADIGGLITESCLCADSLCEPCNRVIAALRASQPPAGGAKFAIGDKVRIIRGAVIREVEEVMSRRYRVTLAEENGWVVLEEEQLELVARATATKGEG